MTQQDISRAIVAHEKQIAILRRLNERVGQLNGLIDFQKNYTDPNSVMWYGNISARLKDELRISQLRGQIAVLKSGLFKMYRDMYSHDLSQDVDHLTFHLIES
jgi:hypothetical protein